MKNRIVQLLIATFLSAAPALANAENGIRFHWPQGQRAAVSLAYDDALDSQLDVALPTLDKYGLKGSFYLQLSNPAVDRRLAGWRAAATHGHELGNHSLFHQCSLRTHDWVQPQRNLDTTSVAQMQDQLALANTMLYAIDGKRERTYTVPCGDTLAAGADYLPAVAPSFVAIKVAGQAVTPSMAALNPHAVGVYAPEGLSGQQLIALVQQAAAQGTMVNFTFHGVGGDYLSTSAAAHEELVSYLAANRQLYWTDTFLNIMTYVKTQRGDH
ncbi:MULTISPECIES: polysaccharide deacetylase family protein [unclassified Duganella]|uniref:polysaccharide deacetylase family protein n=1 Tax=unclassified Duganella TaxID=2636909 RepID=UPI000881B9E3|nr:MULTISPECIES: polysaccharide deacetylase family protein [unclassified Duganella]SDH15541.1 Polysaccharide deacetylase [Duganella sp. OV458]SDK30054.1 Polysaccharide deacetylase [Duganella sp. OV510]